MYLCLFFILSYHVLCIIRFHIVVSSIYIYIYIYIQSTPDKSDTQGTGKSIRLIEKSDLSNQTYPTYPINLTWN